MNSFADDYLWVLLCNGEYPQPDRRLLKAAVDNHPARREADNVPENENADD